MSDSRPIGLFDSGVGGLTVVQEVFRLLPNESIVYFGDNAHVPYGPRKVEELIGFATEIISFLVSCNVKYVIFACNTNSSVSLPVISKRFSVPMIGLVEPGAREAVRVSVNRKIGVVATEATVKSNAYQKAIQALDCEVEVFSQAAPRLVPLVEAGKAGTTEAREAVREYLTPLMAQKVDTVIFGCSHYPFLAEHFQEILGPKVALVDPAAVTVHFAREEMGRLGLLNNPGGTPVHRYYVSGSVEEFLQVARRFMGFETMPVRQVTL